MRRARIDLVDGMSNLLRRDRAKAMLLAEALVWCLAIGWCFVAPKTAWGKARRGSIEEQRGPRPFSAQPSGPQSFSPPASLLAPHRPLKGMLVARVSRETKIPCGETPANCETPH